MPTICHEDLEIHYRQWGRPEGTPLVLTHGLFFSTHMFDRLAEQLEGHWVVAVDVRGHGRSTRPRQGHRYSWEALASDVEAVLDHLGVDKAVVGGLSLGANVTVAFAHAAPQRLAGLVVEMPVLSSSEGAARVVFGLMATALRVGSPLLGPLTATVRRVPLPARPPEARMIRDVLGVQPLAGAALIEGLQASEVPAHDVVSLAAIDVPVLVIGHRHDPIHHHDDAAVLVDRLPDAELVSVGSILELRVRYRRYAELIGRFLDRHGW